jgi:CIC family chloride channel protein
VNRVGSLARLALATLIVGIAAGLAGALLLAVLYVIQGALWGDARSPYLGAATPTPGWLPALTVTAAGILGAGSWYALRRWAPPVASIEQGVAGARMPVWSTLADTVTQVSTVALGSSVGKEVAPRELAAAAASAIARWFGLGQRWGGILIASAAGAGLAAVYNAPLGGAVFALEILLVRFGPAAAVPAFAASGVATAVARPLAGDASVYALPQVQTDASLLMACLVLGPLMGVGGSAFARVTEWLSRRRPTGWRLLVALPVVGALVGVTGMFLPLVLGNGEALAQTGFDGSLPALVLLAYAVAKTATTTATLGAGAVGGILQPSVAIGVALGAAAAAPWSWLAPGADAAAMAAVCGAAFLAASMRAPVTATLLMIEFTGTGTTLALPIVLAVAGATATAAMLQGIRGRRVRPLDPGRE